MEKLAVKIGTAKESGHWYNEHGNLIEQIQYRDWKKREKDGRPTFRAVTLKDARKMNLAPGITSILGMAHKRQLERWKIEQAVMAALTFPRPEGMSEPEYIAALNEDMGAQAEKARIEGTAIHAAIESHYQGGRVLECYQPHVDATIGAINESCGVRIWEAEKSFTAVEGYGTKIDLCCLPSAGSAWVLNFKTKDGDQETLDRAGVYEDHERQQAAERHAFGWWNARCAIVYISRTHPGAVAVKEIPETDLKRGLRSFMSLLSLWQATKEYYPDWAKPPLDAIIAAFEGRA